MKRFVLVSSSIGAGVAIVGIVFFLMAAGTFENSTTEFVARTVFLLLCPSSVVLLVDAGQETALFPAMAVFGNAMLYGVIGWLLWIGLQRSKAVLVFTAVLMGLCWYGLLKM